MANTKVGKFIEYDEVLPQTKDTRKRVFNVSFITGVYKKSANTCSISDNGFYVEVDCRYARAIADIEAAWLDMLNGG
jgi:hypothetical protein